MTRARFPSYQKIFRYKATVARGLEEVLAQELERIQAGEIAIDRGVVEFSGDRRVLYEANLYSRTAMRVVMPLFHFRATNEDQFYNQVTDYPWESIFHNQHTIAIDAATSSHYFRHSMYMSRLTKDAIVDRFRDLTGQRPSVDPQEPDFRFHLHIQNDRCTVSLDSSGAPLFKRGYRTFAGEAPLKETLAAGLLLLSGWDGDSALLDPMCGSGTIPIEAALIAANRAPGIFRTRFGFMNWGDYDGDLYHEILSEARSRERSPKKLITGRDLSNQTLAGAQKNATSAGVDDWIDWKQMDFFQSPPVNLDSQTLLINPPYDERLPLNDVDEYYKKLGDTLKQRYPGVQAWVFSGALKGLKKIGLKPDVKIPMFNGPIESHFCRYKMVAKKDDRIE